MVGWSDSTKSTLNSIQFEVVGEVKVELGKRKIGPKHNWDWVNYN